MSASSFNPQRVLAAYLNFSYFIAFHSMLYEHLKQLESVFYFKNFKKKFVLQVNVHSLARTPPPPSLRIQTRVITKHKRML